MWAARNVSYLLPEGFWLLADICTAILRRPKANPNLFRPDNGRRVSFDDRTTTIPSTTHDDDLYQPASASTGRKWEPIQTVEPEPLGKDPFSIEDSDDEKDGLMKESEPEKEKTEKQKNSVTGALETGVTKKE